MMLLSLFLFLLSQPLAEERFCQDVILTGTVHSRHAQSGLYPLSILLQVIEQVQPDLILLEVSPAELARQHWILAPPEMVLLERYAHRKGIPVQGIDAPNTAFSEADVTLLRPIRQHLQQTIGSLDFVQLQSLIAKQALQVYQGQKQALLPSDHPMFEREALMADALRQALQHTRPQIALVFTGFTHQSHLLPHLQRWECRLRSVQLSSQAPEFEEVWQETRAIWQEMAHYYQQRMSQSAELERIFWQRKQELLAPFLLIEPSH